MRRRDLELHGVGVRLFLDDFGAGYSSLAYLNEVPFDVIKVDRHLVAGFGTERHASAIVAAVLDIARKVGLDVVAEGIESEELAEALRAAECRFAQGYLFARPMPASALEAYLGAAEAEVPAS